MEERTSGKRGYLATQKRDTGDIPEVLKIFPEKKRQRENLRGYFGKKMLQATPMRILSNNWFDGNLENESILGQSRPKTQPTGWALHIGKHSK